MSRKKGDAALFAPSVPALIEGNAAAKRAASPFLDTMAACLTPAGRAAIATLAVWGPRAWDIVRELLHTRSTSRSQLSAEPALGRVWLGRFGDETSDEVVVAVQRIRPIPWVEIHCHGGREVICLLLETLAARGLKICSWQEFQELTNEDPVRSAAAIALADAATIRTASILLDQYHGAFGRAIRSILASWEDPDPNEGTELLQSLVRYAGLGRHLTVPWRLVIAGAANVGKSSLINALAGYQRCVVSPTPGTTRDLVTTRIAIDGWAIELVDTAGLRASANGLEEEGIRLARQAVDSADLCLWVLDASAPPGWPDSQTETMHFVINKVDLKAAWDLNQVVEAVQISALCGSGLAELCAALSHWLIPDPPPPGAAVPFTVLLAGKIEAAWQYHAAGQTQDAMKVLASLLRW